ncbi:MAG: redoxin domain-containing protein [Planctomycetes bacterium]|nr:redoxin domain-containing protein [Planctomycetota bacterium]
MKYAIGAFLVIGTLVVTYLAMPKQVIDECCEYIGLLGPEDVSEVPGVDHAVIEEARPDGQIPDTVPGLKLHDAMPAFTLPDLHGKPVEVKAGAEFTVVTWVSSLCPTSKVYEVRLNELARDFPNVRWVMINSAAMESLPELKEHFERNDPDRLKLPVLKDDGNVIADLFGVRVTTEIFLFDSAGRLQYRGAIDDARNPTRVTTSYLREVLKDLAAGKTPRWRYTAPKGCCPIDRVKKTPAAPAPVPATKGNS